MPINTRDRISHRALARMISAIKVPPITNRASFSIRPVPNSIATPRFAVAGLISESIVGIIGGKRSSAICHIVGPGTAPPPGASCRRQRKRIASSVPTSSYKAQSAKELNYYAPRYGAPTNTSKAATASRIGRVSRPNRCLAVCTARHSARRSDTIRHLVEMGLEIERRLTDLEATAKPQGKPHKAKKPRR